MKATTKSLLSLTFTGSFLLMANSYAAEKKPALQGFEVTPYLGYMAASDIKDHNGDDLSLKNSPHIGLAFSWQDTPTGHGQILVNYVGHEFNESVNDKTVELNILYTHFSGVALYGEKDFTTVVSVGLGATYFDSDYESGIYPSLTAAIGTKHHMTERFALVSELRLYATLTDEDDDFFCKNDVCVAEFGDAVFLDTSISVGFSYAF